MVASVALVALEFTGEVAELYRRYRHGYPGEVVEAIVDGLELAATDRAVDLGCGTGQLTIPLAARLSAVLGLDPEPDMLSVAAAQATRAGVDNIGWMLAGDGAVGLLGSLLGPSSVGVLTVAQALHWIDHRRLFAAARTLLREGGGLAIVSNGIPLWLQDAEWSIALREFLEHWLQTTPTSHCGTDEASRERYAADLEREGYTVTRTSHEHVVSLDLDHLVGGVLSAFPASKLPNGARRERFSRELASALGGVERVDERVPVETVIGRR